MGSKKDSTAGIKSAYELALERLEQQGIDRPREEGLAAATRQLVAEARSRAEAKLAELEILHRKTLRELADPEERARAEQRYVDDRRRIEERRDREIARLRESS